MTRSKPPFSTRDLKQVAELVAGLKLDALDSQVATAAISFPLRPMHETSKKFFGRAPNFMSKRVNKNPDIRHFCAGWGIAYCCTNWLLNQPDHSVKGAWIDAHQAVLAALQQVQESAR